MSRRSRSGTGFAATGSVLVPSKLPIPAGRHRPSIEPLLWPWPREAATSSFEETTVPSPTGARTGDPLLLIEIVDVSPSEDAVDPNGYRFTAGRRIMDLLRTDLLNKADRMAVVLFSSGCRSVLEPTSPHTKDGRRRIRQVLRPVNGDGGTDIVAGLAAGARMIPAGWRGEVVAMLFTDGQDGSGATELARAIGAFPSGSVHVVSVGCDLPQVWEALPVGSTTSIASMERPDHAEWVTAQAAYAALGLEWTGPAEPPAPRS